jgi:2-oxo-hept-3-ene-1,7-dioate hydratase
MEAQLARWRALGCEGTRRVGWKIGLNDPAVQRHFALDAPVVGYLDPDRVTSDGTTLEVSEQATIVAEAEIAIRVGRDVVGEMSSRDAGAAIAAFAPAIELLDSSRPARSLDEILERDIFHEAVVFGAETDLAQESVLRQLRVEVSKNGGLVRELEPTLVPEDLGEIVKVVADTLADHGEALRAGDRIIAGSLIKPVRLVAGDRVDVEIEPLGSVSVTLGVIGPPDAA